MKRVAAIAILVVSACRSSSTFEHGRDAARSGDWIRAVAYYARALAEESENIEYRMALDRARLEASHVYLEQARASAAGGARAIAIEAFELALGYDPTNRYARDELAELRAAETPAPARPPRTRLPFGDDEPVLDPASSEPIDINFPEGSSLRTVLESLAKLAGVNILFDESFRDKRVSVDLRDVTFQEALDILMQTNGLFYKVVHSSSVVVTR